MESMHLFLESSPTVSDASRNFDSSERNSRNGFSFGCERHIDLKVSS